MAGLQHRSWRGGPRYLWIGVAATLLLAIGVVAAVLIFGKENHDGIIVSDAWVRATVPQTDAPEAAMSGMAGMDQTSTPALDMSGSDATGDMAGGEGQVSGAFMMLENRSSEVERLVQVSVSPDIAGVAELHETTVDDHDVTRMRPVDGIDVPAHGSTALQPGGYHIMLLDVRRDLNPGDTITLTLTFQSGKQMTVDAPVRALE
jgi:copper(I)-binding protein